MESMLVCADCEPPRVREMEIGWVGLGRMGYPMAEALISAGHRVRLWNRTRSKAMPLTADNATVVERLSELRDVDVLFTMVSTGRDLEQIYFGSDGVASSQGVALPAIFVDCSSIGVSESSVIRAALSARNVDFLAAPVSGNGKCVKAGKLSSVVSGPRQAFEQAKPLIETYAPRGVSYVGEGELARVCKIAHNVMLGVVFENLAEITLLAQKAGVPRHAFLQFMNNSVMGSVFTQYKTPALVNLDWSTTFTPELLLKDLQLGLEAGHELGVPMPVTAATREVAQVHLGAAQLQPDPVAYLQKDFAALFETMALGAGIKLESESIDVPSGLEA
jgi:3-hydroxyisobutyrate dehydrogenase